MKTIARYPGGKLRLLPQIFPHIEKSLVNRTRFADAFVGGGSVLCHVAEKYPTLALACNDKDWFVYCFWKIVSGADLAAIEELKTLLSVKPTVDLYYQLRSIEPVNEVEAAYRFVFFNRTSFSGDMRRTASPIGGRQQLSKYKIDCRFNYKKIVSGIDAIHKLLVGRTEVSNQDINSYQYLNDDQTMIYYDPPYFLKGKMLYNEYMSEQEHIDFASNLREKNNWILSYDNCPEIIKLYEWANTNVIDARYCIKGAKTNWNKTTEVLILPA